VYERWIFGCSFYKEFQGFKDVLGVLVVNEVKFSFSFLIFFREVLGKRRGVSASCGASLSRIIILWNPFNNSLPLLRKAFCWWLHSIYHHIHCVIVSRPLLFFQRHTNGHYVGFLRQNRVRGTETILVERGKHDCIVGATMEKFNPSEKKSSRVLEFPLTQLYFMSAILA
jgi:hypothetical protein